MSIWTLHSRAYFALFFSLITVFGGFFISLSLILIAKCGQKQQKAICEAISLHMICITVRKLHRPFSDLIFVTKTALMV